MRTLLSFPKEFSENFPIDISSPACLLAIGTEQQHLVIFPFLIGRDFTYAICTKHTNFNGASYKCKFSWRFYWAFELMHPVACRYKNYISCFEGEQVNNLKFCTRRSEIRARGVFVSLCWTWISVVWCRRKEKFLTGCKSSKSKWRRQEYLMF